MTAHDEHAAPDATHHDDAGTLGPIDWRMWGAGVLGVLAALVVVAAFVVATDFVFFSTAA